MARAITVAELDNLSDGQAPRPAAISPGSVAPPSKAIAPGRPPATVLGTLRRMRSTLLPIAFGLGVLAIWEFLIWVTDYPRSIMPAPSAVIGAMYDHRVLLAQNVMPTASVALGGFLIATVVGIALAVIMTWSDYFKEAFYPNIVAFQIVPKVAWAPMFVLWLGIETESRLGFATFISVFPIIISMTAGLRNTDESMLRLCRSLTASKWQILVNVRFPFSLPYLFSAMKISATLAMIGVIVGEFITSQKGLGFVILTAAGRAEADLMIASVVVLCFVGLGFYALVATGTWLVDRWFGKTS
ncbi:MAG: ABC transporter permease [Rhodospirillaceae bacterium]